MLRHLDVTVTEVTDSGFFPCDPEKIGYHLWDIKNPEVLFLLKGLGGHITLFPHGIWMYVPEKQDFKRCIEALLLLTPGKRELMNFTQGRDSKNSSYILHTALTGN